MFARGQSDRFEVRLELAEVTEVVVEIKPQFGRYGARFPTEIYSRGCHWIPRMFA
jgi:hypothetical protein